LGGFFLVAGDRLLCSSQTRLLACHASQTVFLAKPTAKNAVTSAFFAATKRWRPRLQVHLNKQPKSEEATLLDGFF